MNANALHHEPLSLRTCALWAWLALGAAFYLTLLPFEFGNVSLETAWETYRNMSLTGPGTSGRQQFMANVLMFMPLGFFWTAWLTHGRRSGLRAGGVFLFVAALGLAVTATVEFFQVWLPYRHPAGADIAGNFSGAVAGSLAWLALRNPMLRWRRALEASGARTLGMALLLYAGLYVTVGLIPFDFVLSQEELRARLASDSWGWWLAADACTSGIRCYSWLTLELVVSIPVGLLLAWWLQRRGLPLLAAGLPLALLGAALLEVANLFTLSGIVEGRSVLLRFLGLGAGLLLWRRLPDHPHGVIRSLQQAASAVLVVAIPAYALLLLALNHGFADFHFDLEAAHAQWRELNLWPFYYHYFVDEIHALRSTALHLAMYAPLGALVWVWQLNRAWSTAGLYWLAVAGGVLLALVVELTKLFVDGARPDPASLVLAGLAAWVVAAALRWLEQASGAAASNRHDAGEPAQAPAAGPTPDPSGRMRQALGGLVALTTLGVAATWPVAAPAMVAGLLGYAVLLWWRPQAWLLVIPVVLATLDLTLYTGRLFVSELDLFLLMTVAVALWHGVHPGHSGPLLPRAVRWPLVLLTGSTLVALAIALYPPGAWDPGQAVHFAHDWNALRVAKGLLWTVMLLAVLRVAPIPVREQVERWFLPGVALALLAKVAYVIRERATYPGLLDFDSGYRLSGLFSEMQAGGPSIETFLVLALPLALIWCWRQRPGMLLAGSLLFGAGAAYAVAMTYSRGGYLGFGVALAILLAGLLLAGVRRRGTLRPAWLAGGLLPVAAAVLVAGTTLGGFGEQRLGQIEDDLQSRLQHWQAGLELPGGGPLAPILGRGMGSFPDHYRTGNVEGRLPANLAFVRDDEGSQLQLGGGDSLFVNQRVRLPRQGPLTLEIEAAGAQANGFRVFVCEKPIRHSFECRSQGLQLSGDGAPETLEWEFDLEGLEDRSWPFERGLVFSISVDRGLDGIMEFEHVQIRDADGHGYLDNADFEQRSRHWYFITDHLWPWRIENQWLEIYFDQGWLGVLAFVWLTLAAILFLLRRAIRGDALALGAASATGGALAVGLFSTIFFSPRIALLFYLTLLLGVAAAHTRASRDGGTDTIR